MVIVIFVAIITYNNRYSTELSVQHQTHYRSCISPGYKLLCASAPLLFHHGELGFIISCCFVASTACWIQSGSLYRRGWIRSPRLWWNPFYFSDRTPPLQHLIWSYESTTKVSPNTCIRAVNFYFRLEWQFMLIFNSDLNNATHHQTFHIPVTFCCICCMLDPKSDMWIIFLCGHAMTSMAINIDIGEEVWGFNSRRSVTFTTAGFKPPEVNFLPKHLRNPVTILKDFVHFQNCTD